MSISNSIVEKDLASHIHPFTNLARHQEIGPFIIGRGDGVRVIDDQGRSYIEAMSGLWSVGLGFSEKRLVEAATRQLETLPYYHSFSHKAHAPGVELAAKLAELAPGNLNHVHFTNSGSEANDTVVKMVWYLNNALGRPAKKKFLARQQGYHGSTIASASLTGLPASHRDFDLPAIPVRHLTCPHFYRFGLPGETEIEFSSRLAREIEDVILAEGPETIAAFIGEPLIAAGGVIPAPEGYWPRVQDICRRYDILLVVDEIITAFGRLGAMFGSEYYGIQPDIMVLSKQLTSSYQPLAAIVVSEPINEILVEHSGRLGSFVHGFTTTGHPVATAVGLENVRIIEERGLVGHARDMGVLLQEGLRQFGSHPLVGNVRGAGFVGGVELVADKATKKTFDDRGALGAYVFRRAHDHGLIIRAIYDTIAFCPPLIASEDDLAAIFTAFERTLHDATEWAKANGMK
ncbi:aspartate aminotransferase family protein [Mesorhizobium sp. B4-1-4]|uniref:aspartate aminotransferase family protein n=1 Tax=Mesorhizobium sp. B4-1-4 TaxID=2589888 RepID=UPI00112D7BCB|nr:aspartate aminotransferase family protein [Mesorhizobium sp. B4-1-4]UCI34639.1 aspartate aminotransferase family protein [Mesorhizobium sp. B4-1-4]